jgi:hypothetical protein
LYFAGIAIHTSYFALNGFFSCRVLCPDDLEGAGGAGPGTFFTAQAGVSKTYLEYAGKAFFITELIRPKTPACLSLESLQVLAGNGL